MYLEGREALKMKRTLFALLFLALTALLVVDRVAAQEPTPLPVTDDQVNAIAKQLYCPVCENVPLDVCGTQACAQWRELIREQLSQGWTEEEIKQYFAEQYGDRVLAEPPRRGLNWLVYIVPPAAFLAGAYLLFRGIRSWRQLEPQGEPLPDEAIDDDYLQRLEEELRRRGD